MRTEAPSALLWGKDEALHMLCGLGFTVRVEEANPARPSRDGESIWRVVRQRMDEETGCVCICVSRFRA